MKMNLKAVLFNVNTSFDITHNSDKVLFISLFLFAFFLTKLESALFLNKQKREKWHKLDKSSNTHHHVFSVKNVGAQLQDICTQTLTPFQLTAKAVCIQLAETIF